ncbi:MAG: tyrosine-type recombinase/integrase [Gemmatimonadetes bacterium]|nr:tyrosine-type recombinase/integrase [Gemmatimonadota bacterium]
MKQRDRDVPAEAARIADHYVEAILAAVEGSRRPATRRAYASAWRKFRKWTRSEGLGSLPADPMTVAAYLVYRMKQGLSMSSLEMDRKAIGYYHRTAGRLNPASSEGVRNTMAGLRNQATEKGRNNPRQARGLTARLLMRIEDTACLPRTGPSGRTESAGFARRRGNVDIALVSVMRDGLLRRGEAAELRWRDVRFVHDGSARVTIRRSKTSSVSAVQFIGLKAAIALRHIRPANPDPDARVFGIATGRTISNRIAAMTRAAGLGEGFTGHSPRVGMAQDLTAKGMGLTAIMVAGRWKSERMPAYYSRGEAAGRGAVARYYGDFE